jgi:hypothetical protein
MEWERRAATLVEAATDDLQQRLVASQKTISKAIADQMVNLPGFRRGLVY